MEQFRPTPEPDQKQNSPEVGGGLYGLSDRQREQSNLQRDNTADNPIAEKAIEQTGLTKQPRAIFENCIVRSLMSSKAEVDRRLAAGELSEERAKQQKETALAREQMYSIGPRLANVQRMLRKGAISDEDKLRLKLEEKRLKKEWRHLWKKA